MKLSIIIPVYRTQDTLERCLESILQQSFTDYEMILVDDGSDDGSPQLCDEYARKDARIRVIHKENGGLSDARNAGIRKVRGEYITFVDSDDTMVDNTLENLIQEIREASPCRHSGVFCIREIRQPEETVRTLLHACRISESAGLLVCRKGISAYLCME